MIKIVFYHLIRDYYNKINNLLKKYNKFKNWMSSLSYKVCLLFNIIILFI